MLPQRQKPVIQKPPRGTFNEKLPHSYEPRGLKATLELLEVLLQPLIATLEVFKVGQLGHLSLQLRDVSREVTLTLLVTPSLQP